jgi:hypothetical protein
MIRAFAYVRKVGGFLLALLLAVQIPRLWGNLAHNLGTVELSQALAANVTRDAPFVWQADHPPRCDGPAAVHCTAALRYLTQASRWLQNDPGVLRHLGLAYLLDGNAGRAIIGVAECPEAVGQVFNVGSTEEVSILDLARKVVALVDGGQGSQGAREQRSKGADERIVFVPYDQAYEAGFEDLRRRVPEISKIKAMIGWEPQVPLDETLRRVIAFYREVTAVAPHRCVDYA